VAHRYQLATDWHRRIPAAIEREGCVDESSMEAVIGLEAHASC